MHPHDHTFSGVSSRRGMALVMALAVVIAMTGMAMVLSTVTVNRVTEQQQRKAQSELSIAADSASNEMVSWMQNNDMVLTYLKNMTVYTLPYPALAPNDPKNYPTGTSSTSSLLVSTALPTAWPSGMGQTGSISSTITADFYVNGTKYAKGGTYPGLVPSFPDLYTTDATIAKANTANKRNACALTCKVIKIAGSGTWPSGNERFIVYTTASQGSGKTLRRQRVAAVISVNQVSDTSTTSVFTRAMFSIAGYQFKGSATTDSWDSLGGTRPFSAAIKSDHGDLGSNGVLTVQKPGNVLGTAASNLGLPVPPAPYNPPASATATTSAALATYNNAGGLTNLRIPTISNNMVFGGTGTVRLFVDGVMNLADITFVAGSTVKVEIYQNTYSGGAESQYGKSTWGDLNDPSRLQIFTNNTGSGKINGGTRWSAALYAPNATLRFNGNANYYGSMVAGSFDGLVNGNFAFHFDENLSKVTMPSVSPTFTPRLTATAWFSRDLTYGEN